MITKKELEQLESIYKEQEDLKERIEKLEYIQPKIVQDSVKSTSKHFPYIEHTTIIEGLEEGSANKRRKKQIKKLKKILSENKVKILKQITHIEYELKKIEEEDYEIREIIRYKYEDNLTYIQTAHKMNDKYPQKIYTADSIRMNLKRFFEKNK